MNSVHSSYHFIGDVPNLRPGYVKDLVVMLRSNLIAIILIIIITTLRIQHITNISLPLSLARLSCIVAMMSLWNFLR
jgi:hypothetical protein